MHFKDYLAIQILKPLTLKNCGQKTERILYPNVFINIMMALIIMKKIQLLPSVSNPISR